MPERKDENTAQSTKRDIEGAIKMGKEAAQMAKTATEAAARAAAGDIAGAAVTVLRDKAMRKKLLFLIAAPILGMAIIISLFLYSLPVSIFETTNSFFSQIKEEYTMNLYGGTGDVAWSRIWSGIKAGATVTGGKIQEWWNNIQNFFFAPSVGDSIDVGYSTDTLSDDMHELRITYEEKAEKDTLNEKLEVCIAKIEKRTEEIKTAIENCEDTIKAAVEAEYGADYDAFECVVNVTEPAIQPAQVIPLLSLYTVQVGASIQDMKSSDLVRWLGWYDSWDSATMSFPLGDITTCTTSTAWKGTFLPQYLFEQKQQEIEKYGSPKTDFDELSCAAVDFLIHVDCPNLSEINVTSTTETETVPAEVTVSMDEDGNIVRTESEETVTISTTKGFATVNISIGVSDPTRLVKLAGLWQGALTETQESIS